MHAIRESVIETVQLLLEYDDTNINAKCIWMHKTFIIFKSGIFKFNLNIQYFMVF